MDMTTSRIVFTLVDALGVFSSLIVVAAAAFVAYQLAKAKQPAVGGWLLVLGRVAVLVVSFGFLVLGFAGPEMGLMGMQVSSLFLRALLLLGYLLTIVALIMFRPWKEDAHG
jgi:hypothetical protein